MSYHSALNDAIAGSLDNDLVKVAATKGQSEEFANALKQYKSAVLDAQKAGVEPTQAIKRIDSVKETVSTKAKPFKEAAEKANKALETAKEELQKLKDPEAKKKAAESVIKSKEKAIAKLQEVADVANKDNEKWQKRLGRVEATQDRFNKGEIAVKSDPKNVASKVKQSPLVSEAYSKLEKSFDAIADKDEISKRGAINSASTTAKNGKGMWTNFVDNTKANFGKDVKAPIKFARVGGTAVGAGMVIDGITRSKSGDQDRSGLGRLVEVAAGVGVAGASLAAFRGR